jgi:hypothetical protein
MDRINDRWGEFVVTPALMMGMEGYNLGPHILWRREGVAGNIRVKQAASSLG